MSIFKVKLPSVTNIRVSEKFPLTLSRKILIIISKPLVMPNVDYAYIIYEKLLNESLKQKIEMVQCNVAFKLTSAFKKTLSDKKNIESLVWSLCQIEEGLKNVSGLLFRITTILLKGNAQLMFLCNPQNRGLMFVS